MTTQWYEKFLSLGFWLKVLYYLKLNKTGKTDKPKPKVGSKNN